MFEFAIILLIILFVASYSGAIDTDKLYEDNKKLFELLKEKDYDFLVKARYGGDVDPTILYEKRIKSLMIGVAIVFALVLFNFTWINLILGIIIIIVLYKNQYSTLKSHYKKHLTEIDQTLPYYLKSIEILAQHYTIPVAISKSIETAPLLFKDGLVEMGAFQNVLIYGLAGFGKTAKVKQFCREHNLNLFECDAKSLDIATVGGIPYPKTDPKTGEITQSPIGSRY